MRFYSFLFLSKLLLDNIGYSSGVPTIRPSAPTLVPTIRPRFSPSVVPTNVPTSPQLLPSSEIDALRKFYFALNGSSWQNNNWNFSVSNPCSNWYGITCTPSSSNIISINMSSNSLSGTLPPEIGNFKKLQTLILDANSIQGKIPSNISSLTLLTTLNFTNNKIKSDVSSFFSMAPVSLVDIELGQNRIYGKIPNSISNFIMLTMLSLGSNSISSIVPTVLASLSKLNTLILIRNGLNANVTSFLSMSFPTLVTLNLAATKSRGQIPVAISGLSSLAYLGLQSNSLTGGIPSSLVKLKTLSYIDLSSNRLVGSIPSSLGGLTALGVLRLYKNCLAGSIPSQLGNAASLSYLSLYTNSLVGSIPSSIGLLTDLFYLALYANRLSKTIPSAFGNLIGMSFLRLFDNSLTGSIPSTLTALSKVIVFRINQNSLFGKLPSFVNISALIYFDVASNSLTGVIPSSLGSMFNIDYMYLNNNSFSGTLASELGSMNPTGFRVDSNRLTGTLPSSFSKMWGLQVFLVNNNLLSGDPGPAFNIGLQRNLTNIDLSNNQFSSPFPEHLFLFPKLLTLAATSNCFYGTLPGTICRASNLVVLSIAGLRGGLACSQTMDFSYVYPKVSRAMAGSIPSCVWGLPSLASLQVSGNGLEGQLVVPPNSSRLRVARMSSNQMRCTASEDFQKFPFTTLDVSYNKIEGTWTNLANNFSVASSTLYLAVNRLSGDLPRGLKSAKNVDVLSGNVFNCDASKSSLPDHDPNRNSYVCGSTGLDFALEVFYLSVVFQCGVLALFVIAVLYVAAKHRKQFAEREGYFHGGSFKVLGEVVAQLRNWFMVVGTNVMSKRGEAPRRRTRYRIPGKEEPVLRDLKEVQGFVDVLRLARRCAGMITLVILVVCLPLYPVLKLYVAGGTYDMVVNQYKWAMSGVFMSGVAPALLLFFLWSVVMTIYSVSVVLAEMSQKVNKKEKKEHLNLFMKQAGQYFAIFLIMMADVVAVVLLNGLFVYVMLHDYSSDVKTGTQIGKAVLDMGVEVIITMFLTMAIKRPKKYIYWRVVVMIFNSVGAPIVVILTNSDACFKNFFVPPPAVSTDYSFAACINYSYNLITNVFSCQTYGQVGPMITQYTPSFVYNNTCSASLFTSYIPSQIFGYVLSIVLPWALLILPAGAGRNTMTRLLCDKEAIVDSVFPGFIFLVDTNELKPVIPAADILAMFMKDFTILLTFGFISPYLALAVFASIMFRSLYLQVLVGRFTESGKEHAVVMDKACVETRFAPSYCIFVILISSALFQAIIMLDMMSDDSDIQTAMVPSIVLVSLGLFTRVLISIITGYCCKPSDSMSASSRFFSNRQIDDHDDDIADDDDDNDDNDDKAVQSSVPTSAEAGRRPGVQHTGTWTDSVLEIKEFESDSGEEKEGTNTDAKVPSKAKPKSKSKSKAKAKGAREASGRREEDEEELCVCYLS